MRPDLDLPPPPPRSLLVPACIGLYVLTVTLAALLWAAGAL